MIARVDFTHGRHGVVMAGEEVPAVLINDLTVEEPTDFDALRARGFICDGACEDCDCGIDYDEAAAVLAAAEPIDDEVAIADAPVTPLADMPRQALMKVAKERGHEVASTDTKDLLLAKLAEGTTP